MKTVESRLWIFLRNIGQYLIKWFVSGRGPAGDPDLRRKRKRVGLH